MNFNDLGLIDPLLKALSDKGYERPTPIQQQAIPSVLNRKDLLGIAQTGTGKTAAFLLPILQMIHSKDRSKEARSKLRALILTPTRELAIQINENITAYGKYTQIRHAVIYGGVNQHQQVAKLKKGAQVLVATPGRLFDLMNQGYIHLDDIKMFVLDEADRMLDMGFINDIKRLVKLLPTKRQSLFFSATMPNDIYKLSKTILKDPKRIEVARKSAAADTVKQFVYYTNRTSKTDLFIHILRIGDIDQVLTFTRTKRGADRLVKKLTKANFKAAAIHGDKSQNQRQRALKQFKDGKISILVATDIASRGIDIDKLRYVINFDIPNEPESYVHRIGRSGRAGEEGIALSFSDAEEIIHIKAIEKLIKKSIPVIEDHPFPQTDKPMTEAEKKAWNKEKQRRKQEFFANRKSKKGARAKR